MLSSEQRRSLTEAAERYALNVEGALPHLGRRGLNPQSISSAALGLVSRPAEDEPPLYPGHERYVGRLSIPYLTRAGVIGFKFRCIRHEGPCVGHAKYLCPEGQGTSFYNVEALFTESLDIYVSEGEIDALTLTQCGLSAVGIPGATNWKPWWKDILSDFRFIYVFCDGDSAGSGLGRKLQKELGRKVILVEMDKDQDVNSMYVKYGADHIRAMIPGESK